MTAHWISTKACLVAKGYAQCPGIDFDDTFALIARLEAIKMLLSYVSSMDVKLYQIDVKSVFLNGIINDEVYVE